MSAFPIESDPISITNYGSYIAVDLLYQRALVVFTCILIYQAFSEVMLYIRSSKLLAISVGIYINSPSTQTETAALGYPIGVRHNLVKVDVEEIIGWQA